MLRKVLCDFITAKYITKFPPNQDLARTGNQFGVALQILLVASFTANIWYRSAHIEPPMTKNIWL